jgi:DNA-binding beta-propeller fold protein YncE
VDADPAGAHGDERELRVNRWAAWASRTALRRGAAASVLLAWLAPAPSEAAGPWRARVVDGDTRAPIEGVIVLAVWHRHVAGHPPIPIGFGDAGYFTSEEVLTGPDGQFTIPARLLFNPTLALRVVGPELALFRGGYGGWRFAGGPGDPTLDGGMIEMRPLRTPAERLKYLEGRWTQVERAALNPWRQAERPENAADVPYRRAARYEAAINAERTALGLRPVGVGYPHLLTEHAWPVPPRGLEHPALRGASAAALGDGGALYVADTENHRIVKLGRGLELLAAWGRFGRAEGEVQFPRGVAVDRGGTVYVTDWGNRRIQAFTADGRFLRTWGELRPNELGGRFSPDSVAVTDAGELVVYCSGQVYRFGLSGQLLGRWGEPFQFGSRSGVAVDAQGSVYGISGDARRDRPPVRKFDPAGREVAAWGAWGSGPGQLFDPMGLAVDRGGRVYVADAGGTNPRVMLFAPDGRFLHQWDVASGTAPQLSWPHGLAVDARGQVYVADLKRDRLHVLPPPPERQP